MKTTNESLQENVLRLIAKTWSLGRVMLEHERAGMSPTDEKELNEREELTLRLVELFPGKVTETTLVKVFDLHYSQAGQIVDRLSKLGILEKKTGRGTTLKLTKSGEAKAKEVEMQRGYRFEYVCKIFDENEIQQLIGLMEKMYDSAYQQIDKKVFGKLPRSMR
jgi:DNA-binding MarR family transcriptional regulator